MRIKTLLIFPPNFAVDQPYLSIPMLIAFLRKNGIKHVKQFDANIDSFHYFMRKTFLKKCLNKIKSECEEIEKLWEQSTALGKEKYPFLCEASLYFPSVIKHISKSINYFKTLDGTNIKEYNFHKNSINRAFDIVSTVYYPTQVSIRNFSMRYSNQSFSEILEAVNSKENPYVDYFKDILLGKIENGKYNLIGLSITALSQIIPSFTLVFLVKKHLQNVKIVLGGQVFNRLENNIKQIPSFFTYADFLIVNEGETAFLQLIRYLKGEITLDEVPNILYHSDSENIVKKNTSMQMENIDTLPGPDYDDLDLSKYLAPEPVLSYQPVRGCYWHRCKFCNQFLIYGKAMRCAEIKKIINDLKYLKNRYKTSYFTLVNESIRPIILRDIAQGLINENLQIKWYAGARLDEGFDTMTLELLKKSGCEKLYFGLETGSQKVLNEMNKGINLKSIKRILRDCGELGIGVHLFIMLGFPTETKEALESSKRFIFGSLGNVVKDSFSFYISIYQLKPETDVFDNPDKFNIKNIFRKKGYDLEYLYEFERTNLESDIDYEQERQDMETTIDRIIGIKNYPENIVHYVNFKDALRNNSEIVCKMESKGSHESDDSVFYVNPDLTFGGFKYYSLQSSESNSGAKRCYSYLIYDIRNDNLFEIPDKHLWRILKTLNQCLTLDKFQKLLQQKLAIKSSDMDFTREFTNDLIKNHIIVKCEKE